MRDFSDSRAPHSVDAATDTARADEPLGWEGHVNVQPESPMLTKLLQSWPELRTGLAFSMVFVVGALVGGSLAVLMGSQKTKSK